MGTLVPTVTDGAPESSASVLTREFCSRYQQSITVTIQHNEHPVEVTLDHSYPLTGDVTAPVAPGGGSVHFESADECWRIRITHLDLGPTGDDLDYVVDWTLSSNA